MFNSNMYVRLTKMLATAALMACLIAIHFILNPTRYFETNIDIGKNKVNSKQFKMPYNLSSGTWVNDSSYPLYYSEQCPYITSQYNCRANGRPDSDYENWKWQANGSMIPRFKFDAKRLLEKLSGKRLMFVGDSISFNQFLSLACLLHTLTPNVSFPNNRTLRRFRSAEYNASVEFLWAPYLVEQDTNTARKRILHVDGIEKNGIRWKGVDVLVFESSKWWPDHLVPQRIDIIMERNKVYTNMDPMLVYRKAMTTWANWISANIDPKKSLVFFRSPSLSYYNRFNKSICDKETEPDCKKNRVTYNPPLPPHVGIMKQILNSTSFPVVYVDITQSTASRHDGVMSAYGSKKSRGQDCTHWCLPGVPDSWNEILYAYLILK